ncbi:Hypothetical predicted protein [Olea europaea subsp. europaea]|uniref:Uncharacterized protein n=1 Tax=Olea europaea subsp. europaea TaxID=158383 RepID=A0A8S0UVM9_OLEEU|nr:Hypothetical predicted protein [Olea europaea subsp. europaea]
MDTPQARATFLALGDLTYPPKLGSLRYWQKQGCCCFKLVQHSTEGGVPDTMADAQGCSSLITHPSAAKKSGSATASTRTTYSAIPDVFIFKRKRLSEMLDALLGLGLNL